MSAKSTNKFNYKDCKFGLEKDKESTARIVLFKELNIVNSYTLEASFFRSGKYNVYVWLLIPV